MAIAPNLPAAAAGAPPRPPHSAFHRKLQVIAESMETLAAATERDGPPDDQAGKVAAFYLCTFNRLGQAEPASTGPEAAWLRSAFAGLGRKRFGVGRIAAMDAGDFADAMAKALAGPKAQSLLMTRLDEDDLLAIHAAAADIEAALI